MYAARFPAGLRSPAPYPGTGTIVIASQYPTRRPDAMKAWARVLVDR